MSRLHSLFVSILAVLVSLLAFSSPSYASDAGERPLLYGIYVTPKGDFWGDVEKGAEDAAAALGYRIIYRGSPQVQFDEQRQLFATAIKAGAKGIFIAPNHADRAQDVETARKLNIPVVYFDRDMGGAKIASFIGTNNYAAGQLAAEHMIQHFGDKKPVTLAVFRMDTAVRTTTERENGFIDRVKKAGYNVVMEPFITSDLGVARSRIMEILQDPKTPPFDGFFTPNEITTTAAILTLRFLKKEGQYVHIGFDSGDTLEDAIRKGEMEGTIVQQPYRMGYYSVRALDAVLKGRKVEPFIESGAMYVDKTNVDTYKSLSEEIEHDR